MTMTPPSTAPRRPASLEHLLVRFGLVTLDQLSAALREETEHGIPFTDALVRDGVVSTDDLARVADEAPPVARPTYASEPLPPVTTFMPEPVVATEPEPIAAALPEPVAAPPQPVFVPEPTPEPEPAVVTGYVVRGLLVNGDNVEIASVDDDAEAQRIARDAMRACARTDGTDWPVLNGRYVRPESIVAIEVAERL